MVSLLKVSAGASDVCNKWSKSTALSRI